MYSQIIAADDLAIAFVIGNIENQIIIVDKAELDIGSGGIGGQGLSLQRCQTRGGGINIAGWEHAVALSIGVAITHIVTNMPAFTKVKICLQGHLGQFDICTLGQVEIIRAIDIAERLMRRFWSNQSTVIGVKARYRNDLSGTVESQRYR